MALEKVSKILEGTNDAGFAVAAFNVYNYETVSAVVRAAEEEGSPVIAMLYAGFSRYIPESTFVAITRDLADRATVPVGLHLDHSRSFEQAIGAVGYGFRSIMIDGSSLDYEENISLTRSVVQAAHALGVDVESELGFVGSGSRVKDYRDDERYTSPDMAADFIERTEADSLAVAIGSAHGAYVQTPELDLDLLLKLKEAVDVPLVLHGGSGIPREQVRGAVRRGIRKVNIGTELNRLYCERVKDELSREDVSGGLPGALERAGEALVVYVRETIRVLRLDGFER